jgi:hypothetical protein
VKLATVELSFVHKLGLHITEKCDGCGNLLNRTVRYSIAGRPEVYCSAPCRDLVFFGDRREAKKHATPGKCAYCGGSLKGKKRGSIYCDDACRKAHSRKIRHITAGEVEKSRTPGVSNQQVTGVKTGEQGNRIAGQPQHVGSFISRPAVRDEKLDSRRGGSFGSGDWD